MLFAKQSLLLLTLCLLVRLVNGASNVFVVNKTTDDGSANTLRWAISQVNLSDEEDDNEIRFDFVGDSLYITLDHGNGELSAISRKVFINGAFGRNISVTGPVVTIDFDSLNGFRLLADDNICEGLNLIYYDDYAIMVSGRNSIIRTNALLLGMEWDVKGTGQRPQNARGIWVYGAENTLVEQNVAGYNFLFSKASSVDYPILVENSSYTLIRNNKLVTFGSPSSYRVILPHMGKIAVTGSSYHTEIYGNYLGNNASMALGSGSFSHGVYVTSGPLKTYIGKVGEAPNVISGNAGFGVFLDGASDVYIKNNYIGTNAAGTAPFLYEGQPRTNWDGIVLDNASDIEIGGTESGASNLISGNTHKGIWFRYGNDNVRVYGNKIGTTLDGLSALPNRDGIAFITLQDNPNHWPLPAPDAAGVYFETSTRINIGGDTEASGNLISGNTSIGVWIYEKKGSVLIRNNKVGVNVSGTAALPNNYGMYVQKSHEGVTIGGMRQEGNLVSGNTLDGIHLIMTSGIRIYGNRIGTDAAGTSAVANNNGIRLYESSNCRIGSRGDYGNLISGHSGGAGVLLLHSSGNIIQANYIGTDISGQNALPNKQGVHFMGNADSNRVGGRITMEGNLISGNSESGVYLAGAGNRIEGNKIGTDAAGDNTIPNQYGIFTFNGNAYIGGETSQQGNLIKGNSLQGIFGSGNSVTNLFVYNNLIQDNGNNGILIYGDADNCRIGAPGKGNTFSGNGVSGVLVGIARYIRISGNSFYDNNSLAINLDLTGTIPGNQSKARPVITKVTFERAAQILVVEGTAEAGDTVELFSSSDVAETAYQYLGKSLPANSGGVWKARVHAGTALTGYLTATATRNRNTSQLSDVFSYDFCDAPPVLLSDLKAYYPFSGNANDMSGNGYNGSVYSATLTTDRFGNAASAYLFDGVNDYIECMGLNTLSDKDEFSMAFWFKGDRLLSGLRIEDASAFVRAGYNAGNQWPVPGVAMTFDGGTGNPVVFTGTTVQDSQWHHIAVTWKRGTVNGFRTYVDGALVAQRNSSSNALPAFTKNLFIGAHEGIRSYTRGAIDEVYIYSRSLSTEEIGYLYTGAMGELITLTGPSDFTMLSEITSADKLQWKLNSLPGLNEFTDTKYTFIVQAAPQIQDPETGELRGDWGSAEVYRLELSESQITFDVYEKELSWFIQPSKRNQTWYWRVGLQYMLPDENGVQPVQWSGARTILIDRKLPDIPADYLTSSDPESHTDHINWVYEVTYLNDGKTAQTISYMDGLGKMRQQQVLSNTTGQVLATETAYSEEGNAPVTSMVAPVNSRKFGYAHRFFDVYQGGVWEDFSTAHFDRETVGSSYNTPRNPVAADNTVKGSVANYYSNNNPWEQYVDDAGGYPYQYSLNYQDPLGRPLKAAGLGNDFRINSGREVIFLNSGVTKEELSQVYGLSKAAQMEKYVSKDAVIDPNGITSISYKDEKGNTIATAMTACETSPIGLDPLTEDGMTRFVSNLNVLGNDQLNTQDRSRLSTANIMITCGNQEIDLDYSIDLGAYSTTEGFCAVCAYEVSFRVVEDQTGYVVFDHTEELPGSGANVDCDNNTDVFTWQETVTLPRAGTYTIYRDLRPQVDQETGRTVLETLIEEQENLLRTQKETKKTEFRDQYYSTEAWYAMRKLKTDGGDAGVPVIKECVERYAGNYINQGHYNGHRLNDTRFSSTTAMDIDSEDYIYVLDESRYIRKISPYNDSVSTIFDGNLIGVSIKGLSVDEQGGVYFSSRYSSGIYKVTGLGSATLLYNGKYDIGAIEYKNNAIYFTHNSDTNPTSASNVSKIDLAGNLLVNNFLSVGNELPFAMYPLYTSNSLVITENSGSEDVYFNYGFYGSKVYKVSTGNTFEVVAGSGSYGQTDGYGLSASFMINRGIAIGQSGNLLIADYTRLATIDLSNRLVRSFVTGSYSGIIDGELKDVSLGNAEDLEFDSKGNLYFTDAHSIRVIKPCGFTEECEEKPAATTLTLKATAPAKMEQSITPGRTFSVNSYRPNDRFSGLNYIEASQWTEGGLARRIRGILNFDFTQIPQGAQILEAKLYLSGVNASWYSHVSDSDSCWLERITTPYDATVTYNTMPSTTTLNRVLILPKNPAQPDINLNVTNLVKDMLANPSAGYGIMLKLHKEEQYRARVFASAKDPDPARHPRLEVTYVNNPLSCSGLSSTATYASVDLYADPAPMSSGTPVLLGSASWLKEMKEEEFAAALAADVNTGTSTHGFSASALKSKAMPGVPGNKLSVSAPYSSGADYNGWTLRLDTDYATAVQGCFVLNGDNLVYNPAMEASPGGILSDYQSGAVNNPGYYLLADNATDFHGSLPSVTDHTGGGDFMIARGDTAALVSKIWKQGIAVEKNTTYTFSLWAIGLTSENPSRLQLKVNGVDVGSPVTLTGQWREIRYQWNSGGSAVANLSVEEASRAATGNVFGIDDITFRKNKASEGIFTGGADGECETTRWYLDQVTLEDVSGGSGKRIVDLDGKISGVIGAETLQIADPGTPAAASAAMRNAFIAEYKSMHWVELNPDDITSMEVYTVSPDQLPLINDDKTLELAQEDFYLLRVAFRGPSCEDKCVPVDFGQSCDQACDGQLLELKATRQEAYAGLSDITDQIPLGANLYTLKQLVDNFYPFGETVFEVFEDEENDLEEAFDAYLAYEMSDLAVKSFNFSKCINVCSTGGADAENICITCQGIYSSCVGDNMRELTDGHNYLVTRWEDEDGFPYVTIDDMDSDEIGKLGTYLHSFLEEEFSNSFVRNLNNWYYTAGEASNDCSSCTGPSSPYCNSNSWNVSRFPDILLPVLEAANTRCQQEYDNCVGLATNPALTLCEQNLSDCIAIIPEGLSNQDYQDHYDQCLVAVDCSGDLSGVEEAERRMMIYEVQKELHLDYTIIMAKTEEVYQQTLSLTLPELALYLFDYKYVEECRLACIGQFEEAFSSWYEQQLLTTRERIEEAFLSQCYNRNESFTATFEQSNYHYTLYEYDEAGRLTGTVPPEGIDFVDTDNPDPLISGRTPVHRMKTQYESNSLSQLLESETPDGGETRYLYDKAGRIRFSQSAEQAERGTAQNLFIFSYTKYDPETGRVTEIGEFRTAVGSRDAYGWQRPSSSGSVAYLNERADNILWPVDGSRCFEQSNFYYDTPMLTGLTGVSQENVQERVSKVANAHGATYYSYDEHGRAKTVVQELLDPQEEAMRFKTIDYSFDRLTSQVTQVVYQKGVPGEELAHKYTYDADNRLSEVFVARERLRRGVSTTKTPRYTIVGRDFVWEGGGPITIDFWVKIEASDVGGWAFRTGPSGNDRISAHVPWTDNKLSWDYGNYQGNGRVWADYTDYLGQWTHIALVSEGIGGRFKGIYLNGELVASENVSDGPATRSVLQLAYDYKGSLDDFRIWDKVLSAQEVSYYMQNNAEGNEPNLRLYWNFDEPSGLNVNDLTGNYPGVMYPGYTGRIVYDRTGAEPDYAWERVAQYEYYLHGPLKSKGLGEYVQKLDYVYNLQGWLKSINHPLRGQDPGEDYYSNGLYARDVFGEMLNYYAGDYKRTGSGLLSADAITPSANTHVKNKGKDLFNGNISSIVTYTGFDQAGESTDPLMAQGYRYDYLNRLVSTFAEIATPASFSGWSASSATLDNIYQENLSYDANGNITSLERTVFKRSVNSVQTTAMDMMTYHYDQSLTNSQSQSKKAHNRLLYIDDAAADDLDIEDFTDQAAGNYAYDAKGRLIRDLANEIDSIAWTAYDKVREVIRTDGSSKPRLLYTYDGFGRRLSKTVTPPGQEPQTTYYVYDGGGNQLAHYLQDRDENEAIRYRLVEHVLYGASREGVLKNGTQLGSESVTTTLEKSALLFEVSDHLGNVRAVVSGQKQTRTEEFHRVFRSGYEGDDYYGFSSYQDYSAYLDDTRAYDGKRSLRLATNTVWGGPIYGIRVNAGDIVSFEGYTYFEGGPGTTGGEFICKVFDEVSTNEVNVWTKDYGPHNTIAGSWQKAYINNYVVPAVGGSNRVLYMTIKPLAYGHQQTTWFDNLKIVIKSPTRTETVAVADIITLTDYYAFGMVMPGRTICNSEHYRYGFNGMEKDDDWYEKGDAYDFGARMYDSRTGRWQSRDPLAEKYPYLSPYVGMGNKPLVYVDVDGRDIYIYSIKGELMIQIKSDKNIAFIVRKGKEDIMSQHIHVVENFSMSNRSKELSYQWYLNSSMGTSYDLDAFDAFYNKTEKVPAQNLLKQGAYSEHATLLIYDESTNTVKTSSAKPYTDYHEGLVKIDIAYSELDEFEKKKVVSDIHSHANINNPNDPEINVRRQGISPTDRTLQYKWRKKEFYNVVVDDDYIYLYMGTIQKDHTVQWNEFPNIKIARPSGPKGNKEQMKSNIKTQKSKNYVDGSTNKYSKKK